MNQTLTVKYKTFGTLYSIRKELERIEKTCSIVSFDIETRSIYNKEQRDMAKQYLAMWDNLPIERVNELTRILYSSGLSHPSMVQTTHIIIGLDLEYSSIFIVDEKLEKYVFNWLVRSKLKFIIHNASFDLQVVYHRTGKFPEDYEDTQQLAKALINDCNNYHSKTGLKLLVGSYYPPRWSIKEETDYEVRNLKDEHFLEYCAIDGSAALLLWSNLQESIKEKDNT